MQHFPKKLKRTKQVLKVKLNKQTKFGVNCVFYLSSPPDNANHSTHPFLTSPSRSHFSSPHWVPLRPANHILMLSLSRCHTPLPAPPVEPERVSESRRSSLLEEETNGWATDGPSFNWSLKRNILRRPIKHFPKFVELDQWRTSCTSHLGRIILNWINQISHPQA